MTTITTANDIRTWIANNNPGNVLAVPALIPRLAEDIRLDSGRPAWGHDWQPWLDAQDWDTWLALYPEAAA